MLKTVETRSFFMFFCLSAIWWQLSLNKLVQIIIAEGGWRMMDDDDFNDVEWFWWWLMKTTLDWDTDKDWWLHDGDLRLIDVGAGKRFQCKPSFDVCPTLTHTRAKQRGFYLTKKNRALSPTDSLASSSQVSFVVSSFWQHAFEASKVFSSFHH